MTEEPEARRSKGTGVRHVFETIRDEILSLRLEPGQLLDEMTLADRFGMSRSPVREALIRLAGDDLVVTLANRSTIVAPIDIQSFPKYVEALDIAQRMNTLLAAFCERLLNQGRQMLHQHFRFLEDGNEGHLPTDEHDEMLAAIRDRDIDRADLLTHRHISQFRDNFMDFMKRNYLTDFQLSPVGTEAKAERIL